MTDEDLTRFKYDILTVLASAPDDGMYGLELKRALEREYGKEVNHGRLYPNLDDLEDAGLIVKEARDKRTNEYRISRRGVRTLEDRYAFLHGSISDGFEIDHGPQGGLAFHEHE